MIQLAEGVEGGTLPDFHHQRNHIDALVPGAYLWFMKGLEVVGDGVGFIKDHRIGDGADINGSDRGCVPQPSGYTDGIAPGFFFAEADEIGREFGFDNLSIHQMLDPDDFSRDPGVDQDFQHGVELSCPFLLFMYFTVDRFSERDDIVRYFRCVGTHVHRDFP